VSAGIWSCVCVCVCVGKSGIFVVRFDKLAAIILSFPSQMQERPLEGRGVFFRGEEPF